MPRRSHGTSRRRISAAARGMPPSSNSKERGDQPQRPLNCPHSHVWRTWRVGNDARAVFHSTRSSTSRKFIWRLEVGRGAWRLEALVSNYQSPITNLYFSTREDKVDTA